MIHLVTGTPGAGKTLRVVELIAAAVDSGRRVCVHGIPDLILPHVMLSCSVAGCQFCGGQGDGKTVEAWPDWAEKNDLIVLDEAQQQFRNRPAGSQVPTAIQALETHRHRGVDFIVITQSPSLIDQNIRKLVTVHDHIKPLPLGQRRLYTWSECNDNPKTNLTGGESRLWRLNKRIFSMYRSAELHTRQRARIPLAVYMLAIAVAVAAVMGWSFRNRVATDLAGPTATGVATELSISGSGSFPTTPELSSNLSRLQQSSDPLNTTPVDPLVLESAPAYAGLVTVRDFPRLSACISSGVRCKCYTQQGTEYPTTPARCHSFIRGLEFSPYVSAQ